MTGIVTHDAPSLKRHVLISNGWRHLMVHGFTVSIISRAAHLIFTLRLSLYRPQYTAHHKYTRQNLNSSITMRGVGRFQLCCLHEECSGFVPPRYSFAARIKCLCVTVINPILRYLLGRRSGLLSNAFTARAVATVRRHDELLHRTSQDP